MFGPRKQRKAGAKDLRVVGSNCAACVVSFWFPFKRINKTSSLARFSVFNYRHQEWSFLQLCLQVGQKVELLSCKPGLFKTTCKRRMALLVVPEVWSLGVVSFITVSPGPKFKLV